MRPALVPLAVLALTPLPALAQDPITVDVELVLAVDVSRSMDPSEQIIQRMGYAAAFRSAEVQGAIFDGGWGRVAVTYVEWAGARAQVQRIPWSLIDSPAAAESLAAGIESLPLIGASRTSISAALDYAAGLFADPTHRGLRRIIDISGDGPNNDGRAVTAARDAVAAQGITINGLPLLTNDASRSDAFGGWSTIADLDAYYRDCVIAGPGAFAIAVTNWDNFAAAIRRKLVLELAGSAPERLWQAQAPATDCLIGEQIWQERQRRWQQGD